MHIADGVLSGAVLAGATIVGIGGVAVGIRKMRYEDVPRMAVMAAAFFVASLVHIPIGPAQSHLVLNGLCGIILGWGAFPAFMVALFLQSMLFGYGGITVLGINTMIMAAPSVACFYFFRPQLEKPFSRKIHFLAGFAAGFFSIIVSALLIGGTLYLDDKGFYAISMTIIVAHLPISIVEGILTGVAVVFLRRVSPEIFLFGSDCI